MKVLVSIHCLVYNHKPYLSKCLDGFMMQKTNFKYEVIIHDDCSTDGSQLIIDEYSRKYPNIIKPIIQSENQYSKIGFNGIFRLLSSKSSGKYIAFCEGDDYWIDSLKLQKQVDYLEKYPEVGMVHTYAFINDIRKKKIRKEILGNNKNSFEDLLVKSNIATLTTCYRRHLYNSYLDYILEFNNNWPLGDYPTWLWFSLNSKIGFIPETMAVYNLLEESVSHSKNKDSRIRFQLKTYDVVKFFMFRYLNKGKIKRVVNKRFVHIFLSIIKHRSFNTFHLFIENFESQIIYLNPINKLLYKTIKVIC